MALIIHALEIAALLAIAYSLGWVVGHLARRLSIARHKVEAVPPIPAERIANVLGEAVAPTTTEPAATAAIEEAPSPTPVAASMDTEVTTVATAAPAPEPASATVIRATEPAPTPATVLPVAPTAPAPTAAPARRPGEAWSGEVRGRAAVRFAPPQTPAPTPAPVRRRPAEEADAMRAIEGGSDSNYYEEAAGDISRVGVAVAAAQVAVEQMLAGAGRTTVIDRPGKPAGLAEPRRGGKDDLRRIEGVGALDESTLNNLGIYHFDQIAGWTGTEVAWLEDHVFVRGRISRERWQDQARVLIAPLRFSGLSA